VARAEDALWVSWPERIWPRTPTLGLLFSDGGWLRRWPQLWQVACDEFAWVGNRPLNPSQAARLSSDFERLWLAAPIGLISLADAEGCDEIFSDAARAHASFYAAGANWRLDLAILARALFAAVFGVRPWQGTEAVRASFRDSILEQDA